MQPYSREAYVDRRQPYIRWTAVFAGAAIAAGLWLLLQLLLTGGALSAIDPDEVDNARAFGIGTGIGSVLAPLIAIFIGGLLAGRLASHYDRKVAGLHGALVWAITSVLGLVLMASAVTSLAEQAAPRAPASAVVAPQDAREYVEQSLASVNARLKAQGAPTIAVDDLIDAAHQAGTVGPAGAVDRDAFIARLVDQTKLSQPEAVAAIGYFGDRAPDVIAASHQLAVYRNRALQAGEDTGNAMFGAGIGLLLCLGLAIFGAVLGARLPKRRGGGEGRDFDRPDTIPGTPVHTTAPYPASPPVTGHEPLTRREPIE